MTHRCALCTLTPRPTGHSGQRRHLLMLGALGEVPLHPAKAKYFKRSRQRLLLRAPQPRTSSSRARALRWLRHPWSPGKGRRAGMGHRPSVGALLLSSSPHRTHWPHDRPGGLWARPPAALWLEDSGGWTLGTPCHQAATLPGHMRLSPPFLPVTQAMWCPSWAEGDHYPGSTQGTSSSGHEQSGRL